MKITEGNGYHKNPRTITARQKELLKQKLEKLGDLSGVTHDLNSNEFITGNQRSDIFKKADAEITVTEEYDKPTKTGTVALGYITYKKEKYSYRAVRWTPEQCEEAVIVANRVGGEFDLEMLAEKFDVSKLLYYGFENDDISSILQGAISKPDASDEYEKRNMSEYFIVAPFSVLDSTRGEWMDRRRKWNALIGDDGSARQGVLGSKEQDSLMDTINSGTSILDAALAEVILHWFTEKGYTSFDPFAGDTVFGFVSAYLHRPFQGIELRKEQADFNQHQVNKFDLEAVYHCDTSENMDLYIDDESRDFVFSCPPYFDLEHYSDLPADLSNMSQDDFFRIYTTILQKTYRKLKNDRFAVIVIGEVRNKKTGAYISLVPRTIDIMVGAGYQYYNEVILINSVGTLPMRAGKQMNSGRKVGKRHQNVLVFYKGNIKNINKNFSDIIPKTVEEETEGAENYERENLPI